MAVTSNLYANFFDRAASGVINWASDTIKMGLLTASYTPNLATHVNWSDVSASEVVGTAYTAGGATLGTKTRTVTAANSFGTSWAASTAYAYGAVVRPATGNGFLYMCVAGGTTGGSAPSFSTVVGATTADNTVTWANVGESITQWGSAAVTWAASTITAQYAIIYDNQTGVAATSPLILLVNFGANQSSSNGSFTVTPATLGWAWTSPA